MRVVRRRPQRNKSEAGSKAPLAMVICRWTAAGLPSIDHAPKASLSEIRRDMADHAPMNPVAARRCRLGGKTVTSRSPRCSTADESGSQAAPDGTDTDSRRAATSPRRVAPHLRCACRVRIGELLAHDMRPRSTLAVSHPASYRLPAGKALSGPRCASYPPPAPAFRATVGEIRNSPLTADRRVPRLHHDKSRWITIRFASRRQMRFTRRVMQTTFIF